ncbi:MAG: hypothetical protein AVDCRST_MAG41-68, partial [uncultured Corynebacteriales bacterium]
GQGTGRPLVLQRRDRPGREGPGQARLPGEPPRPVRHPGPGRARPGGPQGPREAQGGRGPHLERGL